MELNEEFKLNSVTINMVVRGSMNQNIAKAKILKWALDCQLKNFAEGVIVDIGNVYFYRLRFMNLKTNLEY